MKAVIVIPDEIVKVMRKHLFQSEIEQGAFLFAQAQKTADSLTFLVEDFYLIPPQGWDVQMDIYLQMKDSERGKVMQMARKSGLCAIDCHSHPRTDDDVWFSPSDVAGITEFAQYAKWKLEARPFAAMVWAEASLDAVAWFEEFDEPVTVSTVRITGDKSESLVPTDSWFQKFRGKHRYDYYE